MSSLRRAAALLLMPAMGLAQDFDAGLSAATTGDYAVALREWTPLAEQATRVRNPISTKKLWPLLRDNPRFGTYRAKQAIAFRVKPESSNAA